MTKIPNVKDAEIKGKVVLMRVDHNSVKNGKIKDTFKIDKSKETIMYVLENGGLPVLMSHFGRPKSKKTGEYNIDTSVNCEPVVEYIREEWSKKIEAVPVEIEDPSKGLEKIPDTIKLIEKMKSGDLDIVYLPNTRWFIGEEGEERADFTSQLASLADIYVYDAFGSWQPHATTYDVALKLPSYAGLLVAKEIEKLSEVTDPEKPMFSAIAGAKISTKMGTILALHKLCDSLLIGGIPLNALLSAKYGVKVNGISEDEITSAKEVIEADKDVDKVLPINYVVKATDDSEKSEDNNEEIDVSTLNAGEDLGFVFDASSKNFNDEKIKEAIVNAKTIFVNAVLGYDKKGYTEGTKAFFDLISENKDGKVFFGGGDTLGALKKLCPEYYEEALTSDRIFLFTGGGTILKAIKEGGPYELPTIKALMENKD